VPKLHRTPPDCLPSQIFIKVNSKCKYLSGYLRIIKVKEEIFLFNFLKTPESGFNPESSQKLDYI